MRTRRFPILIGPRSGFLLWKHSRLKMLPPIPGGV